MRNLEMQIAALMRLCTAERETDKQRARAEVMDYLSRSRRQLCTDPEYLTRQILLELGAPDHLVGHPYVIRAILLVMSDRLYINNITFGLYPQLAVEFDTTPARVERAIRHLIEVTWCRGDLDILQKYFGNTISASRGKPTNGEFIARMANVVKHNVKKAA
jgi:two-component system response regulator (stage 0 sporulation protein A)